MIQNASKQFPPISTLPMLSCAMSGALDAAKDQLKNLQKAKNKPYVLDDQLADRIIQSYSKQNESIAHEKAICIDWKKNQLSAQQNKTVEELLDTLEELEQIHQEIFSLAEHIKKYTIDKIIGKSDVEVALAYLAGELPPLIEHKISFSDESPKNKSFKLPPDVIYHKKTLENNGISYLFRHNEWGEIGRIEVISQGQQSQINTYVVVSDPQDPLGEMRTALFRMIALEFDAELERIHGKSTSIGPPTPDLNPKREIVASKLMICETCDAPVALLVFAPNAYTPSELEDYARMMYGNIRRTDLPTWVIGAEEEVLPEREGVALILKIWPDRQPAKKISSLIFEPMLGDLQNKHCP